MKMETARSPRRSIPSFSTDFQHDVRAQAHGQGLGISTSPSRHGWHLQPRAQHIWVLALKLLVASIITIPTITNIAELESAVESAACGVVG